MSLLEAMASAESVIAADVGGVVAKREESAIPPSPASSKMVSEYACAFEELLGISMRDFEPGGHSLRKRERPSSGIATRERTEVRLL